MTVEFVAEFVPGAETEPGPEAESELVTGDASEYVASAGLAHRARPGPVHRSELVSGAEFEVGLGAAAEAVGASQQTQQRRPVVPSYGPALLRPADETPAAPIQQKVAELALETEELEMIEAED